MSLEGKGYFIWKIKECEGGDAQAIASLAAEAHFSHVLIKIADGASPYNIDQVNNVDLVPPVAQALRAQGIAVWGWHYVYGDAPESEARIAIQRVRNLDLDGYVIDAEGNYKEDGKKEAAKKFMSKLRADLGDFPIALSSYRFPSFHPRLPWREFLEKCDLNMPQVYWEFAHNPAPQLSRSVREFQDMTPSRPVIPVGSAYKRNQWAATPADVLEFLQTAKALNLTAANFWEWGRTRNGSLLPVWNMIRDFPWALGDIPLDIVQQYFEALQTRDPQKVMALYDPSAAHVSATQTLTGHNAIRSWYQSMFNLFLPNAKFTLTGFSGVGNSRHFTWTAVSPAGTVQNGNDIFGLLDGKIVYHYTFFSVTTP